MRFARKYGVPCVINFILKDVYDVKSLVELKGVFSFFDISTNQVEGGFKVLGDKVAQNEFRKSKKHINDGIELI